MCEIPSFLCETQENRAKNVKKCAKMKKIVRNPKKIVRFLHNLCEIEFKFTKVKKSLNNYKIYCIFIHN
jgi:hypothetical protein